MTTEQNNQLTGELELLRIKYGLRVLSAVYDVGAGVYGVCVASGGNLDPLSLWQITHELREVAQDCF